MRDTRPKKIGTVWKGEQYIHGPRRHLPSRYSKFRLGDPTKTGKRMVFGKVKGKKDWEIQSVLTPIKKHKRRTKKGRTSVKSHKRKVKKKRCV